MQAINHSPVYSLFKLIFFRIDPEKAHYLTMTLFSVLSRFPGGQQLIRWLFAPEKNRNPEQIMGLSFSNRVGLAAGFDKNAEWIDLLSNLGFGFIEIGTVTPNPQPGNPAPRLFRIIKHKALINRMGFNNNGVNKVIENLKKVRNKNIIIGGNIGKNKDTANENAIHDYVACFQALYPYVHYFVVNVSSPNTPGLRELQEKEPLMSIIEKLIFLRSQENEYRPILLKIAPDLTDGQLDDIAWIANQTSLDGLVCTNTTLDKQSVRDHAYGQESGGLSGSPVFGKSNYVVKHLRGKTSKIIIGVGGVADVETARAKMAAGADLIQVYTGFIYEGPGLVKKLVKGLF